MSSNSNNGSTHGSGGVHRSASSPKSSDCCSRNKSGAASITEATDADHDDILRLWTEHVGESEHLGDHLDAFTNSHDFTVIIARRPEDNRLLAVLAGAVTVQPVSGQALAVVISLIRSKSEPSGMDPLRLLTAFEQWGRRHGATGMSISVPHEGYTWLQPFDRVQAMLTRLGWRASETTFTRSI